MNKRIAIITFAVLSIFVLSSCSVIADSTASGNETSFHTYSLTTGDSCFMYEDGDIVVDSKGISVGIDAYDTLLSNYEIEKKIKKDDNSKPIWYCKATLNNGLIEKIELPEVNEKYRLIIPSDLGFKGLKDLSMGSSNFRSSELKSIFDVTYLATKKAFTGVKEYNTNMISIEMPTNFTISSRSFIGCTGLESIIIKGSGNLTIGSYAFGSTLGCTNLNSVDFGNSTVTIEDYAFSNCTNLNSVDFGNSTVTIEDYAFSNCTSLKSIDLSNVKSMGSGCFSVCTSLENVTLPGITSLNSFTFNNCTSLKSISIPNTCNEIKANCFNGCTGLESIELNNVSILEDRWISSYSSLNSISISPSNTSFKVIDEILFDFDIKKVVLFPLSKTGSYTVPDTVMDIGIAFKGCSLSEVIIANNVTSIADGAFNSCSNLKSVDLSDKIKTIGKNAFWACSSLKEIDLNSCIELTSIGASAFFQCKSLKNIELPGSIETIAGATNGVFAQCTSLESVSISFGDKPVTIGQYAFGGCTSLKTFECEKGAEIDQYAFNNTSSLETVKILGDVSAIGKSAFNNLSSLKSVIIDGSVGDIGESAFAYCNSAVFSINGTIGSVGKTAFSTCRGLTSIYFGDVGTINIGEKAFFNCVNLNNVSLGCTGSIGASAFGGCEKLTTVTLPKEVTSVDSVAFTGCSSLKTIIVEEGNNKYTSKNGLLLDGKTVILSPAGLSGNVTIPDGVETIGEKAFYLMNVTLVNLPDSLLTIESKAFSGSMLQSISIPSKVSKIKSDAFEDCGSLSMFSVDAMNVVYYVNDGILIEVTDEGDKVICCVVDSSSKTIPASVIFIGENAFLKSSVSKVVYISESENSCLNVSKYAFKDCDSLKEVTLISSGKIILCSGSFEGCSRLSNLIVQGSAVQLKPGSITDCDNIIIKAVSNQTDGDIEMASESIGYVNTKNTGYITLEGKIKYLLKDKVYDLDPSTKWFPILGAYQVNINNADLLNLAENYEFTVNIDKLYCTQKFETESNKITFAGLYSMDDNYNIKYTGYVDGILIQTVSDVSGFEFDETSTKIENNTLSFKVVWDASSDLTLSDIVVMVNGTSVSLNGSSGSIALTTDIKEYVIRISEKEIDKFANVSFDLNNSSVSQSLSDVLVGIGRTIPVSSLPMPDSISGYDFTGWYYDKACTNPYDRTAVSEDLVLYAGWSGTGNARLFFKSDDATITPSTSFESGNVQSSVMNFTYSMKPGYEFRNWIITHFDGTVERSTAKDLSIDPQDYDQDLLISIEAVYYSTSNTLMPIINTNTPAIGDVLFEMWSFRSENTNTSGMTSWTITSTPLIVGNSVFVYVGSTLYKLNATTGVIEKSATVSSIDAFYRYLGYGSGYILEYNSGSIYDVDLNYLGSIEKSILAAYYNEGFFYGIFSDTSGLLLKKFSISESAGSVSVIYDTNGSWKDGVGINVHRTYGTTASPVFNDGYVYFITTDGADVNWNVSISSICLNDGSVDQYDLPSLTGRYLDDGWLTYYDNKLYLPTYMNGIFDSNSSVSLLTVITLGSDGSFEKSQDIKLQYTEGEGNSKKTTDLCGITSQLVIYNGRGYINVNNGSMENGRLLIFDITELSDGDDDCGLIYSEVGPGTHGSIVLSTGNRNSGNNVYIYLLSYMKSKLYIFSDNSDKSSASGAYAVSNTSTTYGSQGVRSGADGQLIWYDDSGTIYCFADIEKYPYYFFIEDENELTLISGTGSDQKEALKNALDENNIQYAISYAGSITSIKDKSGWYLYYYDASDYMLKTGTLYNTSLDSHVFYLSSSVDDYRELDTETKWYLLTSEGSVSYSLIDLLNDSKNHVDRSFSSFMKYLVKFDLNGGTSNTDFASKVYESGKIISLTEINAMSGYKFIGWSDGESLYLVNDSGLDYIVSKNVTFTAQYMSENNPVTIVSILKDGSTITDLTLSIGSAIKFTANVLPATANTNVIWSSDNKDVLTVEDGKIVALSMGTAKITVTSLDNGMTAECNVTVVGVPVSSISVDETLSIVKGQSQTLTATVNSDATDKTVTWSSGNTAVAIVDSTGKVTALSAGTVAIIATSSNGLTATCIITVTEKAVTGVVLSSTSMTLDVGKTSGLVATVSPTDAGVKTVIWSSSNSSVATVDQNGNVTAISAGTAIITVKTTDGGKTATCSVTVKGVAVELTELVLSSDSGILSSGDSMKLTVSAQPSTAILTGAVWSSSNISVATVSNGIVTAVATGNATITVTVGGISATCSVTVISANNSQISVIADGSDDSASVTIPSSTMEKVALTDSEIKVSSSIGTVTLSNDVVSSLSKKGGDVRISIESVDKDSLSAVQKNLVGDSLVVSLKAMSGNNSIHDLGGKVTVKIPYVLRSGLDSNNIHIYYLSNDGTLTPVTCVYNESEMTVSFETDHFSYFVLSYEGSDAASTGMDVQTILIAGIFVMLVLIALIFGYLAINYVKNNRRSI